jgi:hypothetical protein
MSVAYVLILFVDCRGILNNEDVFFNYGTATNDGIGQKRTPDFGETVHGCVLEVRHTWKLHARRNSAGLIS